MAGLRNEQISLRSSLLWPFCYPVCFPHELLKLPDIGAVDSDCCGHASALPRVNTEHFRVNMAEAARANLCAANGGDDKLMRGRRIADVGSECHVVYLDASLHIAGVMALSSATTVNMPRRMTCHFYTMHTASMCVCAYAYSYASHAHADEPLVLDCNGTVLPADVLWGLCVRYKASK
jgi:hypothetical protein